MNFTPYPAQRPESVLPFSFLAKRLHFLAFLAAFFIGVYAHAFNSLTINNIGCQTMKVYKQNSYSEEYKTTINASASWTVQTNAGTQWIYRKSDETYLGSYTVTQAATQTDNFNAGGCLPNCNNIAIITGSGTITVTGLDGAPVTSLQVFSSTWQPIYSCFANCGASQTVNVAVGTNYIKVKYYSASYVLICEKNQTVTVTGGTPCVNLGGDSDGDGVCNINDCQPNNPAYPTIPGTACNDGNPNTINDVIQNGGCICAGMPVIICDNVANGGTIGFGTNCAFTTTVCNTAAPNLINCTSPSGGSGNLEIIWLKSTTSCTAPTTSAASIIAGLDPHWSLIAGQTGLTYNPGVVSVNTCFLRCAKRTGCDSYVESNILTLAVDCAGGSPNCNNINISTGSGSIIVTGLGGAPISSLQVFSSTWQQLYNCFANCGASQTVNVPAGSYYVYAKYYSANYALICEKQMTVIVGNSSPCASLGGDSDGDGVCNVNDCQPYNPAYPAIPGTPCNDGNPNTTNDLIQLGGCTCSGTATATLALPNVHPKFINQLPSPPRINATGGGTYNITMDESIQNLGLYDTNGSPMQTKTWGYTYNGVKMYLGPTFVTMKNVPVDVKWMNNLPNAHGHLLPVDHTIHMAHPTLGVPTVVHLHGGHTEPQSDGFPEAWFTNNFAEKGASWVKQTYHYSLDQEAAPLWYHDHALGVTRLNVYAGLAGAWFIRDNNELSMNLPTGIYERELVIQDKSFSPDGQLFFPSDPMDPTLPNPSIMPEFFGDYMMVNGKVWPVLDVAPGKYRFRVYCATDSRFLLLKLSNGASFQQISTDDGLLNNPVTLTQLLLGPGERADIIIDFTGKSGQQIVLQNIGPDSPFQGFDASGAVIGGPADPATTGQVMMFRVNQPNGPSFTVPNSLRQPIQFQGAAQNTRQVLLFEGTDNFGRILPSLGTVAGGQLGWIDPVTEKPVANTTEIWEIYNTTMDAHPIHLHQVAFEIIDRQEFMADQDPVTGALSNIMLMGAPTAPAANERGWKDTGINLPMQRTRFKVRFDIPGQYVWHCHILSHEDHDMMRPMEVLPAGSGGGTPDCANVQVNTGPGKIIVNGLTGAPVTQLQIFNAAWQPFFSCFNDCGATKTVTAAPGTYYVKVKYYSASYQVLCEVNVTVNVTQLLAGTMDEVFQFFVNKQMEHTEVDWVHNAGYLVHQYELERSLDGTHFEPLATEPSRGNRALEHYNGFDISPAIGNNYYRVKAILLDGTVGYSEAKMVHFTDLIDFSLYPNPSSDFVNVNLESVIGKSGVTIQLFNNLGLKVKQYDLSEVTGRYYQMDIRDVHEGHYIVWLNVPGKQAIAKTLVVGKM